MWIPAARHEIGNRDPVRSDRTLRQKTERAGDIAGRDAFDLFAVENDMTGIRPDDPCQCSQKRGLAAGIGANDDGEETVRNLETQIARNGPVAINQRDVSGFKPAIRANAGGSGNGLDHKTSILQSIAFG
ncbi:hypothetical protein D3C80_545730 [compost metagenome]